MVVGQPAIGELSDRTVAMPPVDADDGGHYGRRASILEMRVNP